MATNDDDKAGPYGSQKCYMNIDGMKKMIDDINAKNATADFQVTSIFFGGSTQANMPQFNTQTTLTATQGTFLSYLRSKNPFVGIYYCFGENDSSPAHFSPMDYISTPGITSTLLAAMDTAFNPGSDITTSSTMVTDTTERTSFTQHGYFKSANVIIDTDVDRNNLA